MASPDVLPQNRRSARPEPDDETVFLVGSNGRGGVRLIETRRGLVIDLSPEGTEALAAKLFEASVRVRTTWPAPDHDAGR